MDLDPKVSVAHIKMGQVVDIVDVRNELKNVIGRDDDDAFYLHVIRGGGCMHVMMMPFICSYRNKNEESTQKKGGGIWP